jgi:hypothetical protein
MSEAGDEVINEDPSKLNHLHLVTYLDCPKKLRLVREEITGEEVAAARSDVSIFEQQEYGRVKEFDSRLAVLDRDGQRQVE